jgi:3-phosphoshikimate 1-carboxyvinyltransferase
VNAWSEAGNGCPPVVIESIGIEGGPVSMDGSLSSQYFTALAMVMPYATSPVDLRVKGDLVSKPYLDITAAAMASFGVTLNHENYERFWVNPGERYSGRIYDVEPDASSASYFFDLAAVTGGSIAVRGLPWSSAQGDLKFVDVLKQMGCTVDRGDVVTVTGPARLAGVDVDMNAISDTVMSLAAIAPFASDPVTIRNVEHIRHKETDRISAITTELRRLGIQVDERPDSLTIYPGSPTGATVETYDDHRMAMAFAVTGTRAPGISIQDPGCVSKTVPRFWDILFPLLGKG